VPRRLLPQQPAVPVRRGHRAARGRGRDRPGAGAVRVPGHRPVVLPVHEHVGRRSGLELGRVRGRLPGRRRGCDARRPGRAADCRRRARRDARARPVRLRALFVLPAGHGERRTTRRGAADQEHIRRAHPAHQRVGRTGGGQAARVHLATHGRPRVRLTTIRQPTTTRHRPLRPMRLRVSSYVTFFCENHLGCEKDSLGLRS